MIFLDHSNLSGDAYLAAIEQSKNKALGSVMEERLILVDTTNSVVDKKVLQALKSLTAGASSKISKIAVIGVPSGLPMFFIKTVALFSKNVIHPFKTKEAALDWLTDDA